MKIKNGNYVKCFLKYGVSVEGEVLSWEDDFVEIKSKTENSISLISNPSENIFLVKILVLDDKEKNEDVDIEEAEEFKLPYIPEPSHYDYPRFFKNKVVK